jgi:hypothetical protein
MGKRQTAPLLLEVVSPGKRVRAEAGVGTVWIGSTVYPECPVWRVWYDGRPVVDTSTVGLATAEGPLGCGMRLVKTSRHRPRIALGPGRALAARFADREGRELEMTVRVTDTSAFCAVRRPRKRKQAARDLSVTRFPDGSVALCGEKPPVQLSESRTCGHSHTSGGVRVEHRVCYTPGGKVVAFWRHGLEQHVVFFDRPSDLAERRFGVLEGNDGLAVVDGRQGCEALFLTVPFLREAARPPVAFGAGVTPAYRAAFGLMLERTAGTDGDFWMMRGEPGELAVAARRTGDVWLVGGVTATAQTLTVRFEDLWLRTPPGLRALRYTVEILRDPTKGESGDRVEESFAGQAPDVRVALDLAKSGGFLLTFTPEEMSHG